MKTAQIFSMDMIISVVVFAVFMSLFVGIFVASQSYTAEQDTQFELEYVFANLENNLRFETDPNLIFLRDYRINAQNLANFFASVSNTDTYIVGSLPDAHGIGLSEDAYDTCLYLTDTDGSRLRINGLEAVGSLKSDTCHNIISSNENPCDEYSDSLSLFKPVLYDNSDQNLNRIIQLNLVICRA